MTLTDMCMLTWPTLGIGRGCDGLGSMLVGGQKNYGGMYIEIFGLWGVYIAKFTERPHTLT